MPYGLKTLHKKITAKDRKLLAEAVALLESPSFLITLVDKVGRPVEWALAKLPVSAQKVIHEATQAALEKALEIAMGTLDSDDEDDSSDWLHKLAVMGTGAIGGSFGVMALPLELPISTGLMLRSIAEIARSEGENLRSEEARLACLEVFAMGGRSADDDAARSSYLLVRAALARELAEAADYLATRGIAEEGAPVLIRLLARIAERFGVQVSEKAAAEAVPIVGALGGATINLLFMDHFQDMARGHFIVRRLERKYGSLEVSKAYQELFLEMD